MEWVIGIGAGALIGFILLSLWASRRQERLFRSLAARPGWMIVPTSPASLHPWYVGLPGVPAWSNARVVRQVVRRGPGYELSVDLIAHRTPSEFRHIYALRCPTTLSSCIAVTRLDGRGNRLVQERVAQDGLTRRIDSERFEREFSNLFSVFAPQDGSAVVTLGSDLQALMVRGAWHDFVLNSSGVVVLAGFFSLSPSVQHHWLDDLEELAPRLLADVRHRSAEL